eukprot:TRINITY_DN555_c0_g1_i1.p1 TRINITY_DN555_c0_g1~~TRINITY_DN555_c0_g1_i1.p1  ORF type:complete len:386 (-),score=76.75 TRINITY_DN555_c0_g1_i1:98-1255(-)
MCIRDRLGCVLSLDNGLGQKPPMGWNSWNKFACEINETLIQQTANRLVETGLAALGYVYVNLDDCWQLSRDINGYIVEDNNTFPSGIKALSDYVHSKGLKFGLYSDAGFLTCQKRPGGLMYERQDAQKYAEWEVDYLKYDNCYAFGIPVKWRYERMRNALNETGRPIFFSMCEWGFKDPAHWAREYGNSWRTTGDINDTWASFLDILDRQVEISHLGGPGGWNDPDMLEVGNGGMTTSEYEAHFALWALLKSPLLIGCDLTTMTEDTKRILMNEEIIELNQDDLGKSGVRLWQRQGEHGLYEVWVGELSGNELGVIMFNRGEETTQITVSYEELKWNGQHANVRDLYARQDLGLIAGELSFDVPSHSVKVLRVSQSHKQKSARSL